MSADEMQVKALDFKLLPLSVSSWTVDVMVATKWQIDTHNKFQLWHTEEQPTKKSPTIWQKQIDKQKSTTWQLWLCQGHPSPSPQFIDQTGIGSSCWKTLYWLFSKSGLLVGLAQLWNEMILMLVLSQGNCCVLIWSSRKRRNMCFDEIGGVWLSTVAPRY